MFDQGRAARWGLHLLDIQEENFPKRHREVLYRLLRAGAEQKILDTMDFEDDILTTFQKHARETSDLRQVIMEKEQAIMEKDRLIADRE